MATTNRSKGMLDPAEAYKKKMKKPPMHSPIPKASGQPKEVHNFVKSEVHMERHKIDGKPMGKQVEIKNNGRGFGMKRGQ